MTNAAQIIRTTEEQEMLAIAFRALNTRYRVLAPVAQATVTFPAFDPCKAVQAVARVSWPATVAMRNVVLTHTILEADFAL